ncbi:MAG: glycosyltransferase [Rickettsiales bacterium]|nr:glycosyltransferase [Rickettsiales bacterium]
MNKAGTGVVSVIIPIKNAGKHLAETLECVVNQTHKNLEIICVLDSPEDNSADIVRKFQKKDPRLRSIESDSDLGPGRARNAGAGLASGEWMHFMDADDLISPDFYEKLMACAERFGAKKPDAVSCEVFYEKRPEHGIEFKREALARGRAKYSKTDVFMHGWMWRWMIRRSFWKKRGMSFPNLSIMEDAVVSVAIACHAGSIALCPGAIYYYKNRSGSISSGQALMDDKKRADWLEGRLYVRKFVRDMGIWKPSRLMYHIRHWLGKRKKSRR